jgi:ketosteroid isomerase-like protein
LAQTLAVARRWAAALHAEKIQGAGFYTATATWDHHAGETHLKGAAAIENIYRDSSAAADWSKGHILAAPGVAAWEGVFTAVAFVSSPSTPALDLLAVDRDKVAHEEIFQNEGPSRPVTFFSAAPGPDDTAAVAAKVAAAVGIALASGDQAALHALVASDVLFFDTTQPHGVRGWDALLAWWAKVPQVRLENKQPIVGKGWAVLRWTVREVFSTGVEVALPGATVMEVRDGKVVRMTLYYDSKVLKLQP